MSEPADASGDAFWGGADETEALRRYHTLVNTLSDGIFRLDDGGRFVAVNDALVEMVSGTREELVGERASAVFEDCSSPIDRELDRLRTEPPGGTSRFECTVDPLEGERVRCDVRLDSPADGGTLDETVGVVRDVTHLDHDERAASDADREGDRDRTLERRRVMDALEAAEEGISLLDDGEFIYVNEAYAETFGYDPAEMIGEHWDGLGIEENPDRFYDEVLPNIAAEDQWTGTSTCVRSDGTTFRAQHSLTHTRDEELICVVRDVTEHRERERALEESERRYRTLVEHFPNGAVTLVDDDLRYQTVGGSPLDVADVTAEEVVGRPVREAIPDELADDLVPCYEDALAGESSAFEAEAANGVFEFQTVPIRDENGEVFAALGMSQDVTEQIEREQALQESKSQLQALIELLPVAVFVAEDDGRIVEWNEAAEEIWGGEVAESESVAEYDRYVGWWADTGERVEPDEWALARALRGEEVTDPDVIEIEGFDGERRTVLNHGMPVRDADGEVTRAVVTLIDITERNEYQRRLEESNERLEQFAYAASHDLQEPLRMVSSYLRLVEQRYADALDEDGQEFVDYAVDGADRMREMIEGLLQYSRVETRGDPFEPVDLDSVLDDVLADLQVTIEESGAEITTAPLPQVTGDEGQLRQLFQNLLDNAIEYSGEDRPRVHVEAERVGSDWHISVTDEGIGIDPADQERVFEVFQSLHAPVDYSGTGIGLALCERIVERHGGGIWVDSEPGERSTFTFTLPVRGDNSE